MRARQRVDDRGKRLFPLPRSPPPVSLREGRLHGMAPRKRRRRKEPSLHRGPGPHRLLFSHPSPPPEGTYQGPLGFGGYEMNVPLGAYEGIVGPAVLRVLRQLGEKLAGGRGGPLHTPPDAA